MRYLLLIGCLLLASTVMADDPKIATVDMQKLFKAYPGTKQAEDQMEGLKKEKEGDLAETKENLQDLQQGLQDSEGLLSKAALERKQREYEQALKDYGKQQDDVQTELTDRDLKITQTLVDRIKIIVARIAEKEGLDMVLDSADTVNVKGGKDLTDDVLKAFSNLKPVPLDLDADNPSGTDSK